MCITACLLTAGMANILIPSARRLSTFIIGSAIGGYSNSGIDVGSSAWILELWSTSNANPYIQTLHASHALGITVAPLIAEPFLSVSQDTIHNIQPRESRIHISYYISTALFMVAAVFQIASYYLLPYKANNRCSDDSDGDAILSEKTIEMADLSELEHDTAGIVAQEDANFQKRYSLIVIVLISILVAFQQASEETTFVYMEAFVVSLDYTKTTAAYMATIFSLSYTVGRLVAIFIATRVRPVVMIYVDISLLLIGYLIIYTSAINSYQHGLWAGFLITGFGCASFLPSILAFLEERINVTNYLSGVLFFSSSLGPIFTPLIMGTYIKSWPLIFIYINLFAVLTALVLFVLLHSTDRIKNKGRDKWAFHLRTISFSSIRRIPHNLFDTPKPNL